MTNLTPCQRAGVSRLHARNARGALRMALRARTAQARRFWLLAYAAQSYGAARVWWQR